MMSEQLIGQTTKCKPRVAARSSLPMYQCSMCLRPTRSSWIVRCRPLSALLSVDTTRSQWQHSPSISRVISSWYCSTPRSRHSLGDVLTCTAYFGRPRDRRPQKVRGRRDRRAPGLICLSLVARWAGESGSGGIGVGSVHLQLHRIFSPPKLAKLRRTMTM